MVKNGSAYDNFFWKKINIPFTMALRSILHTEARCPSCHQPRWPSRCKTNLYKTTILPEQSCPGRILTEKNCLDVSYRLCTSLNHISYFSFSTDTPPTESAGADAPTAPCEHRQPIMSIICRRALGLIVVSRCIFLSKAVTGFIFSHPYSKPSSPYPFLRDVNELSCGNITRKLQNYMLLWQVSWLIPSPTPSRRTLRQWHPCWWNTYHTHHHP